MPVMILSAAPELPDQMCGWIAIPTTVPMMMDHIMDGQLDCCLIMFQVLNYMLKTEKILAQGTVGAGHKLYFGIAELAEILFVIHQIGQ